MIRINLRNKYLHQLRSRIWSTTTGILFSNTISGKSNYRCPEILHIKTVEWKKAPLSLRKELVKFFGIINYYYLLLRFSRSASLVIGILNNRISHVTLVSPAILHKNQYPFLNAGTYVIGPCVTGIEYRGLGIYPAVLDYISHSDFAPCGLYIFTSEENKSSIRGIEKAGYKQKCKYIRKCRFGFVYTSIIK